MAQRNFSLNRSGPKFEAFRKKLQAKYKTKDTQNHEHQQAITEIASSLAKLTQAVIATSSRLDNTTHGRNEIDSMQNDQISAIRSDLQVLKCKYEILECGLLGDFIGPCYAPACIETAGT